MSNITDVLLVLPPTYQTGRIPDYNPKEPMGLMYLSAVLRERGLVVEILDADLQALTIDETIGEIRKRNAPIIGFSVLQRALPSLKLLVEGLRKNGVSAHMCCGGFTATLSPQHILSEVLGVDSIVLGDGEFVFADLVAALKTGKDWRDIPGLIYRSDWGIVATGPGIKPDLDQLPWPSRDLLPSCLEKTNYATILASRGCYGTCTFCSNQSFERASLGGNWRGRSPSSTVDEIEYLRATFNQ